MRTRHVVALVVITACSRKAPPAPPPAAAPSKAVSPAAEAQPLLDAWLAAQNTGQFEAYAALYAEKFHGVRRSGPRVRRFERKAWLEDRARMFKKAMKVALSDVAVASMGTSLQVRATQTWESGSYRDKGPKRFLLVRENGALKIAQEEMLASDVQIAKSEAKGAYLLVLDGEPVLTTDVDGAWEDGEATIADGGGVARARVKEGALPDDLRRWKDQEIVLYDRQARRCTATIAGFEILATADWHFGTTEEWNRPDADRDEIRDEIWEQGQHVLVAKLAGKRGDCDGAILALPASAADRPVHAFTPAQGSLLDDVERRARRLFLSRVGGDEEKIAGSTGVYVAETDKGDLVVVSHHPEECTTETGDVSATLVYRVGANGTPKLAVDDDSTGFRTPLLAVDLNGDGKLEILFSGFPTERIGALDISDGTLTVTDVVEIPFYDCGC